MKAKFYFVVTFCAFFLTFIPLKAQKDSVSDARTSVDLSKEIIDPATMLWQLQLEEKWITKFSNLDGQGQKFRVRMIIPVEKGIFGTEELWRLIMFFNTIPTKGSGLGDITWNEFFLILNKDWGKFGVGYNLQIPTARNLNFGSKQWSVGPALTLTIKSKTNWSMYYIVQNFFSISKNSEYGSHASMVFQPNIFYTWSNGLYTGLEPLWQWDFKTGGWDIPLNWRVGYIFQSKKIKYNVYVEPEWKTIRSDSFRGNNEDFAIKFGFRIFLPE